MFIDYINNLYVNFFNNLLLIFSCSIFSIFFIIRKNLILTASHLFKYFNFVIVLFSFATILGSIFNIIIFNSYILYLLSIFACILLFQYKKKIIPTIKYFKHSLKKNIFIYIILILLLINSLLPAMDNDSFLYHLSVPYRLIINNFSFSNESWFHSNLFLYGEIINLIGLSYKSDNLISLLNFIYLVFFYLYLIEKKIDNYFIFFISSPIIYFFIISQKFFFGPMIILFYVFIKIILKEQLTKSDYIIFYFAIFTKFTFLIFLPFFYLIHIYYNGIRNSFINLSLFHLLFFTILSLPILIFRFSFLDNPLFPFYFEGSLLEAWYLDMKNFMSPNFYYFIDMFIPLSFNSTRSFLGILFVFIPITFFSSLIKKDKIIFYFIILISFSFIFIQTSSRFYYFVVIIFLIYYIIYYSNITKIKINYLINLAYFQSIITILLLSSSILFYYQFFFDISNNDNKINIYQRYATDYNYINELNDFFYKNNISNTNAIIISRSNIFFNGNFLSIEMFDYINHDLNKNLELLKSYVFKNNIQYFYGPSQYADDFSNSDCIESEKIFDSKSKVRYSRNPLSKVNTTYTLYKFNILDDCF